MMKEIPVNDNWLYRRGFHDDYLSEPPAFTESYPVSLPHTFECTQPRYYDERGMRRVATYSRVLTVPTTYNGKRLLLRFEGVLSYVEVYVNGTFVTSHKGETPFVADITAPMKYDFDNLVVLKVDAGVRKDVAGSGVRGPLTLYGGIFREISFLVCDSRDICDVCVRSVRQGEHMAVTADVTLREYYPDTELEGGIYDADGKQVGTFAGKSVIGASARLHGEAEGVTAWSPDTPVLYTAVIRLKSGRTVIDSKTVSFGFVSAVFARDGFYLNGVLTKLVGLNRADSYPVIGRSATAETERRDARIIKSAGCNAVRTMGLAGKDFLDECARIGLMVIEDVYGDGYIGDASWRDAFLGGVTDMVLRDRNNPAVIGWGVRVHNSDDCDELYFKACKAAKEADPTRATVGGRGASGHVYEDVFGYNETGRRASPARVRSARPTPYIVTEFGGGCPARPYDDARTRLKQAFYHADMLDKLYGGGIGTFGMSFCDFATPRQCGHGDNRKYCGVFDAYRNPKLAAYVYMSQRDDEPVMTLSGGLAEDDCDDGLYVFTNADSVAVYRDDEKVGEFFPDRKRWAHLPHPPIRIDDFCGNLPAREVGDNWRLRWLKDVIAAAQKRGLHALDFWSRCKAFAVRKACKLDARAFTALAERYMRNPPTPVTYRFEGVYKDEVRLTRTLTADIHPTLRIEQTAEQVLECGKTYERICFSLFTEDGFGNPLYYDFLPVSVRTYGSVVVEGSGVFSLEGGMGGFYVRGVAAGRGVVTVTSELGTRNIEFECKLGEFERV